MYNNNIIYITRTPRDKNNILCQLKESTNFRNKANGICTRL